MGAIPALSAGVSLIGGIAGMSAKNKAAQAQREQLQAQSYQQAQQAVSNEAILASQQQLAQTQYNTGVIAQMASFQQADFGLQAQKQLSALQAQQKDYAIQTGELQQAQQLGAQVQQLQRQAAGVTISADQQRSASNVATANTAAQGSQALDQLEAQLSAEDRKKLSLESSGNLATSSNTVGQQRQLLKRISTALGAGLDMDSTQVSRALQNMNERDLATIGEQLGLADNSNSVESVATNLKLVKLTSDAALQSSQSDQATTQAALDFARQNNLVNSQLTAQGNADSYQAQNYSLGVQRATNTSTAASVSKQNAVAQAQVKGAGLLDYLNFGVNTLGAASPLLYKSPAPTPRPSTLYSGFPDNNYG